MKKYLLFFFTVFFLIAPNIYSTEPDEMLNNQKLEKKAREIGKKLRCMVCQNEDIENSNADIAKDLRLLVRRKLTQGLSEKEIISYIHSRYGDFVLFSPPFRVDTLPLWILPVIFGIIIFRIFFRKT